MHILEAFRYWLIRHQPETKPTEEIDYVYFNPDFRCKETGKNNDTLIRQYGVGPHKVVSSYGSATSGLGYNLHLKWTRHRVVGDKVVEKECFGIHRVLAKRCMGQPEMVNMEDML